MNGRNARLARSTILKCCAEAPDHQIAVAIESLQTEFGMKRIEICDLLLAMQEDELIDLSIWHAPTATCVPYAEWRQWERHEFFEFGVHDQGRIRINILPQGFVIPELVCL
jgi:hypothetical protein